MNTKDFLNTKVKLISIFLLKMPSNILDISFDYNEQNLDIQIVLLKDTNLHEVYTDMVKASFKNVNINLIFVTKEVFNMNKGNWLPSGYVWLSNVLYSKAEVL